MKKHIALIFAGLMVSGFAVASSDAEVHAKDHPVSKEIVSTEKADKGNLAEHVKKQDGKHRGKGHKKDRHERHFNKLSEKLDLTDAQLTEIKEIRKNFEKNHPKPDVTSMTNEERGTWFKTNKGHFIDLKNEIGAVLTPEQKDKAREFYQEKNKKHQERKRERASKG